MTNIKLLNIGDTLPVNDKLAGIVPMALPAEQAALTEDIGNNGLREPVVLWHGKIVDGRCRQIACTLAGRPLMARELDSELTEDEVIIYVKSVNTRRNLSTTQKVVVAAKESMAPGSKAIHVIAKAWGVSERALKSAKYIAKHEPSHIEDLFNGKTVNVMVQKGFGDPTEVATDKISVIAKAIKIGIERDRVIVDTSEQLEWNPDSQIKTEAGKAWFASIIDEAGSNVVGYMIELAYYKFRMDGDK